MNYRLDKKAKNKKYRNIALVVVALVLVIIFNASVFDGLSKAGHVVFRPVLVVGNTVGNTFTGIGSFFSSKKTLMRDNEQLQAQLKDQEANNANYAIVVDENAKIKEILGRKTETSNLILSAILSKPNRSPYDTLIIDIGADKNILAGDLVFALGNIPIGRVNAVFPRSANVVLFSNPGEKTDVVVAGKDSYMQLIGRGGGNFEMVLPRDFTVEKDTEVHLPGITPYVVGVVSTIISDPRDAFTKALLASPVNIQQLKFVQVQK